MRHTLLLVAALGLIAVTGPSALAQEQEKPSSQPETPTTSEPTTQQATPAVLPTTYAQPSTTGQVISPYTPTYSGTGTPCGYIMPSAHIPGTVMFGSQFPQYQPLASYGSFPQTMIPSSPYGTITYSQPGMQVGQPAMQYAQPGMQVGQSSVMPGVGSVAGSVVGQPFQTEPMQMSGMTVNGMAFQPGTVIQTGAMGTFPGQSVILGGYTDGSYTPVMTTTTQSGRRGLFGRRR
jgi:hypothetical protein